MWRSCRGSWAWSLKGFESSPCAPHAGASQDPPVLCYRNSRAGTCKAWARCASQCAAAGSRRWNRWRCTCRSETQSPAGALTAWSGTPRSGPLAPLWDGNNRAHQVSFFITSCKAFSLYFASSREAFVWMFKLSYSTIFSVNGLRLNNLLCNPDTYSVIYASSILLFKVSFSLMGRTADMGQGSA